MTITNLAHNAALGYLGDPQPTRSLARWAKNYGLRIDQVAEALAALTYRADAEHRRPIVDTDHGLIHFNDGVTDPVRYRLVSVPVWDIGTRRHVQCLNGLVEVIAHGALFVFDGFGPLKQWAALNHIERCERGREFTTRDSRSRKPR